MIAITDAAITMTTITVAMATTTWVRSTISTEILAMEIITEVSGDLIVGQKLFKLTSILGMDRDRYGYDYYRNYRPYDETYRYYNSYYY